MSVRIRMKKMGRAHRQFFRICAMDKRSPRDGRVLEELGTYDPMAPETDARAILKRDRIDYWLGVGAQPSEKVAVLIKKYGTDGTHLDAQQAALDRLAMGREIPDPGEPASLPRAPESETPPEATTAEAAPEAPADQATEETKAEDQAAEQTKPADQAADAPSAEGEQASSEEATSEEDAADAESSKEKPAE